MATKTPIKEYYYKNGEKAYMFKIYLGVDPLTGKESSTTRRGFKKKSEAELAYNRMKYEINIGQYKKQQFITYQDVYDKWIVQYKKGVEDTTFDKTFGIFKNHILPAMAEYRIDKIDYGICQEHYSEWAKKLSRVNMVKSYASKVMDHAIKLKYIETNPFNLVEHTKKKKKGKKVVYYTREQLIEFL